MLESQQIILVDPATLQPFPSLFVSGRMCVAVGVHRPFAIKVVGLQTGRTEAIVAVDGRDTLTNRPADPSASGIVFTGQYLCRGFRVSETEVREFVVAPTGHGMTTAERNDSAECAGLIATVLYSESGQVSRYLEAHDPHQMRSFGVTRGSAPVTRGSAPTTRGSVGAAAGQSVESRVGQTTWTRGHELWRAVVEYDTREGWAARGINIPGISMANPWPGEQRFAAASSL